MGLEQEIQFLVLKQFMDRVSEIRYMVQKIMKGILLTVAIILLTEIGDTIEHPMLPEEAHQLILK